MEEYRNKVSNLHANLFQNISKFTSESYLEEHPEVNGGPWGGPYPCGASSRPCSAPQIGGATGIRDPPSSLAVSSSRRGQPTFGCHGNHGNPLVGPKAPWPPPCWGGKIHSREARGVNIYLGVPWYPPRMAPPLSGLDYGPLRRSSESTY